MSAHRPTVSVMIPTFNRMELLKTSLESVLAQTFEDFEVVISDNASTDGTEDMVRAYPDARIVYAKNPENIGWQRNMSVVLAMAKGEFLGFLPDDDLMMPDNLAMKVAMLRQHRQMGLVHSKYHVIDGAGVIVKSNTMWGHGSERDLHAVESGQAVLRRLLLGYNTINLPTVLFRRECYDRLGGFSRKLHHTDDYEYWMKIAVHYDVGFLAAPLVKWRVHAGTLSSKFVQGSKTGVSDDGLREQVLAKHMILATYRDHIEDYDALKRAVDREVRDRVVLQADLSLDENGRQHLVRRFLIGMCREFPRLCWSPRVWWTFGKTLLSPQLISLIKRVGVR